MPDASLIFLLEQPDGTDIVRLAASGPDIGLIRRERDGNEYFHYTSHHGVEHSVPLIPGEMTLASAIEAM